MTRRFPDSGVHEKRGINADRIVAVVDHRPPEGALDVVLELNAERAIIPRAGKTAVDLRAGEDKAPPLCEGHNRLHHVLGWLWHGITAPLHHPVRWPAGRHGDRSSGS